MPVGEHGMAFQRSRGCPALKKVYLPLHTYRLLGWKEKSRHRYNSSSSELIRVHIQLSAPSFPLLCQLGYMALFFLTAIIRDFVFNGLPGHIL